MVQLLLVVLASVCLTASVAIGLCLNAVTHSHEQRIDRWFPYLVLLSPIALVALAVAPLAAVTTLLSRGRKLSQGKRAVCHSTLAASGVLYAALVWICPLPFRPDLPQSVREARQFLSWRRLLATVDGVDWNRLEVERGKRLSPDDLETLRVAADGLYDLLVKNDLTLARTWGARCEFMLGKYRDAIDLKEFPQSSQIVAAHLEAVRACERRSRTLSGIYVKKLSDEALVSTLASAREHHRALLRQVPGSCEAKESARLMKSLGQQIRQNNRLHAAME